MQSQAPRKKPKAFVVKRGEYFDGPVEDEELTPLEEVALPRSMIEEEEEKEYRKRFNKGEDEELPDFYQADRHAAVKVREVEGREGEGGRSSSLVTVAIAIVIVFGVLGGGIWVFRDALRPQLEQFGIVLPE